MSQYLYDEHLEFLKEIPDNELNMLAEILKCKKNKDVDRWKAIAAEIQTYGGDTIINAMRGHGVLYKEILKDVCCKLGISSTDDVYEMESNLLKSVLNECLEDKTAQEIIENATNIALENEIKVDATMDMHIVKLYSLMYSGVFLQILLPEVIRSMAAKVVKQAVSRLVTAWAGPIGWAIGSLTMIPLFSGPAYRITIRACVHVACLRRKHIDALLENNCNIHAARS